MSDFDERARRAADGVRRALDDADMDVDRGTKKAKRAPGRMLVPVAATAAIALIGGLTLLPNNGDDVRIDNGDGTFALAGALQPFAQCDSALDYFKTNAPEYLIKRAGGGDVFATAESDGPVTTMQRSPSAPTADSSERSATTGAQGTADASSSPEFSTTNVNEKGVDEPDIVKTDGTRIVAVTQGKVRLLNANNGSPVLRSTLPDSNTVNVFFRGDRLVVFRSDQQYFATDSIRSSAPGGKATIGIYDIADIANPKAVSTLDIDGTIVDARLVDNMVRVVTSYSPDVNVASPEYGPNGDITEASKQRLRDAVAKTTIDEWLPTATLRNATGGVVGESKLVECGDLGHPKNFSGLDTVGLTTFDITESVNERHSAGVVGGGQQVYATADNLYVTSTDWTTSTDGSATDTDIHQFSTDANGRSAYRGSGEVPGTLLNQYSMSEHNGVLRIATTSNGSRGWVRRQTVSEGMVTTLRLQDGSLRQVGQVGGLGKEDNESIYAVRFVGDRGYVVTFRQTDPLYVLDLRDPAAPKVTGELKIPGFSSYLHPVGENLILGVGQSGASFGGDVPLPLPSPEQSDPSAGVSSPATIAPRPQTEQGVEFSLFDVSDPANPRKIGSQVLGSGQAGAAFDPKAFLYWQPRDLIIAPVSLYGTFDNFKQSQSGQWTGLVLLRATSEGLQEVGRLQSSDNNGFTVNRSFVINDNVYLLSDAALQVNNLDSHKQTATVRFP